MMPHMKEPPSFVDFVGTSSKKQHKSPELINAMLAALAVAWGAERIH